MKENGLGGGGGGGGRDNKEEKDFFLRAKRKHSQDGVEKEK